MEGGSTASLLFMSDFTVLALPARSLPVVSLALSSRSSLVCSLFSKAWLSRLLLSPFCTIPPSYLFSCSSLGLVGRNQGSRSRSPLCLAPSVGDCLHKRDMTWMENN